MEDMIEVDPSLWPRRASHGILTSIPLAHHPCFPTLGKAHGPALPPPSPGRHQGGPLGPAGGRGGRGAGGMYVRRALALRRWGRVWTLYLHSSRRHDIPLYRVS